MALTKLNIAVFAPMPSASVRTATLVKPGFLHNCRKAKRRSFITQSFHGIDVRSTAGGNEARRSRNDHEQEHHAQERDWVGACYPKQIQLALKHACRRKAANDSDYDSNGNQSATGAEDQAQDINALGTQSDAHTNLAGAHRNEIGENTIDPNHRQRESE